MTVVGAAVSPKTGQTWPQAIAAFETLTGRKLPVRRCYDHGVPASFAASQMRFDVGARKSVWSFKPAATTTTAAFEALAKSVADLRHPCDVIIRHEPVDDADLTGPDFVKLYRRAAAPFRAANIPVGVCFTNYSCNRPYSDAKSALHRWWPGAEYVDFIAIDDYPIGEIDKGAEAMPWHVRTLRVAQFADAAGVPLGVAEYGVNPAWDAAKCERWLRSLTDWAAGRAARGRPLRWACYFHSSEGSAGPWWLTKAEHVDAYKNTCRLLA